MPPIGAECPYLQQRGLSAALLASRNRGIMRFASAGAKPFTAFAADMGTDTVITHERRPPALPLEAASPSGDPEDRLNRGEGE